MAGPVNRCLGILFGSWAHMVPGIAVQHRHPARGAITVVGGGFDQVVHGGVIHQIQNVSAHMNQHCATHVG